MIQNTDTLYQSILYQLSNIPSTYLAEVNQMLSSFAKDLESNTNVLYEGLNLETEIVGMPYGDLENTADLTLSQKNNSQNLAQALDEVGGIWQEDETETLEELLNMFD